MHWKSPFLWGALSTSSSLPLPSLYSLCLLFTVLISSSCSSSLLPMSATRSSISSIAKILQPSRAPSTLAQGAAFSGSAAAARSEDGKAMPKKVSVIGGGLGGLAFAQAMKNNPEFEVTVYERDQAAEHRSQGYQIGIHSYGLESLRKLQQQQSLPGLGELLAENPMDGVIIANADFEPYVRFPTGGSSLLNRWKLRDILKQGVSIEWNKRFINYEETADSVKAFFEDGSTVECDLLVAADGVKSRVREQYRPDFQFHSTGIGSVAGFFGTDSPEVCQRIPRIGEMVKGNLCRMSLNHRQSLLGMRFIGHNGNPQLLWAISFDKDHCSNLFGPLSSDDANPALTKEGILRRVEEQNDEVKALIELTPPENMILQSDYMSMVPESIRMAHKGRPASCPPTFQRVVLLGDAAHAMTTHAGLGANTAIKDAVDLADNVQDPSSGLLSSAWNTSGHAKYEKELFQRGYKAVTTSLGNTKRIHGDPSAVGVAVLKTMGFAMKSYNLLRTGKFSF
jgi:2-polyprenyl-6-methoxyphenol hydroxylase-like FAD-dependent oxidoreductase